MLTAIFHAYDQKTENVQMLLFIVVNALTKPN